MLATATSCVRRLMAACRSLGRPTCGSPSSLLPCSPKPAWSRWPSCGYRLTRPDGRRCCSALGARADVGAATEPIADRLSEQVPRAAASSAAARHLQDVACAGSAGHAEALICHQS